MKRHPRPDTRPDWRDPDMPVLRKYIMGNGTVRTEVDPDYERRFREHMLTSADPDRFPKFRADPTYNLRRKK